MHDNLSFYFKTGSSKFIDFFLPILPSYSYDAINKVVLDFGDLVCTEIRVTRVMHLKVRLNTKLYIFFLPKYTLLKLAIGNG